MAHRHYGLRASKLSRPPLNQLMRRYGVGTTFIAIIIAIMIVLGVGLYVVNKAVTDVTNTTTSNPPTTGQGGHAP
jgi:cell division protein FtsX